MARIEGRNRDGSDRDAGEIPAILEKAQLLASHDQELHEYAATVSAMAGQTDEEVTPKEISAYIDSLLAEGWQQSRSTAGWTASEVLSFMVHEEGMPLSNPVKKGYACV